MEKIYNGGKNYGESLDDIHTLLIGTQGGYYVELSDPACIEVGDGSETTTIRPSYIETSSVSTNDVYNSGYWGEQGDDILYETNLTDVLGNISNAIHNVNIPIITSDDHGKALTVINDEWGVGYPAGFHTGTFIANMTLKM